MQDVLELTSSNDLTLVPGLSINGIRIYLLNHEFARIFKTQNPGSSTQFSNKTKNKKWNFFSIFYSWIRLEYTNITSTHWPVPIQTEKVESNHFQTLSTLKASRICCTWDWLYQNPPCPKHARKSVLQSAIRKKKVSKWGQPVIYCHPTFPLYSDFLKNFHRVEIHFEK